MLYSLMASVDGGDNELLRRQGCKVFKNTFDYKQRKNYFS